MGVIDGGAFDSFSGRVGNLVGSSWKNKSVLRKRPKGKKNRTFSQGQLSQQVKFKMMGNFYQKLTYVLNVTLKAYTAKQSAFNVAMKDTLNEAVTGTYPNIDIDYSKIIISKGNLPHVNKLVVSVATGSILFEWDEADTPLGGSGSDRAYLIAYCPEVKQFAYRLPANARIEGSASLDVSKFSGKVVHTWIGFLTDTYTKASETIYKGPLTVL